MSVSSKEVKLIEINAGRKTLLLISAGMSIVDGLGHIIGGLGYSVNFGSNGGLIAASQVINLASLFWGLFMLGIGLLILYIVFH